MTKFILAFLLAIVIIVLVAPSAECFWEVGHMTVAQIAKDNMKQHTIDVVNWYYKWLSEAGPFPTSPDFVNGASLADDLKSYKLDTMNAWHFVNYPFDPSNYTFPTEGCPLQKANSVNILSSGYGGLMDTVKYGLEKKMHWTVAFALIYIVHVFGDASQPLHCIELFSKQFPGGDYGGNEIKIWWDGSDTKINLHGFWDSLAGRNMSYVKRPMDAAEQQKIEEYAQYLVKKYPISEESKKMYDMKKITNESYELATKYAYYYPNGSMVQSGDVIGKDYQAAAIPIIERQLVRGGFRLANQLEYLFKDAKIPGTTTPAPAPPTTTSGGPPAPTATPTTTQDNPNNHHTSSPAAPAPPPEDNKWNSKATGAFIGGIVLGAALVIILYLVYIYVIKKDGDGGEARHAIPSTPGMDGQQARVGYTDLNNSNA